MLTTSAATVVLCSSAVKRRGPPEPSRFHSLRDALMRLLTRGQAFEREINTFRKSPYPVWTLRWCGGSMSVVCVPGSATQPVESSPFSESLGAYCS